MFSVMFLILAAICNAVMDNISHHFYKSIFHSKKYPEKYWNPEISWKNKRNRIKWYHKIDALSDAWHVFKMLMIVFMCLSIITFKHPCMAWWEYPLTLLIYGIGWNVIFNLFYDKLLNKY